MEKSHQHKGDSKNQSYQIILIIDLTALKLNGILAVYFLEIQSELNVSECKIGHDTRSCDEREREN